MCQACVDKCKENEKPTDVIKASDSDMNQAIMVGVDIMLMCQHAYATLKTEPQNTDARNVFILVGVLSQVDLPPVIYQELRDADLMNKLN